MAAFFSCTDPHSRSDTSLIATSSDFSWQAASDVAARSVVDFFRPSPAVAGYGPRRQVEQDRGELAGVAYPQDLGRQRLLGRQLTAHLDLAALFVALFVALLLLVHKPRLDLVPGNHLEAPLGQPGGQVLGQQVEDPGLEPRAHVLYVEDRHDRPPSPRRLAGRQAGEHGGQAQQSPDSR